MIAVRLSLLILLVGSAAFGNGSYVNLDPVDFVNRPAAYQGRIVKVTAEVCAINADRNSLQLFDPLSKALIDVNLTQLTKSQREALLSGPIRRVAVYGKAELKNDRIRIDAHRVDPQTSRRIQKF